MTLPKEQEDDEASEPDPRIAAALGRVGVPTLWMLGKTGAGKSSLVQFLTGTAEAEVGGGYAPKTASTHEFDFPDSDSPLMRFLDTRGLGEAGYDPAGDIAECDGRSHLLIVVVRAADMALDEVVTTLRAVRKERPQRPVLLVFTCLHELTDEADLTTADLFDESPRPLPPASHEEWDGVRRVLVEQYRRFDQLFDRAVSVDLTPVEWGFGEPDFGGDRLQRAILEMLPDVQAGRAAELFHVPARPHATILYYATAAAASAAVPVPWVDLPVVGGLQLAMTQQLAKAHGGTAISKRAAAALAGGFGAKAGLSLLLRGATKLVPVVGSAINAAGAFAMTYATGFAASYYFEQQARGRQPGKAELRAEFARQLTEARRLWKQHHDAGDAS